MIQQIGRKLRQQIQYISGELCSGLGVVASRFVEEAIFGISSSGSVRLNEIPGSFQFLEMGFDAFIVTADLRISRLIYVERAEVGHGLWHEI